MWGNCALNNIKLGCPVEDPQILAGRGSPFPNSDIKIMSSHKGHPGPLNPDKWARVSYKWIQVPPYVFRATSNLPGARGELCLGRPWIFLLPSWKMVAGASRQQSLTRKTAGHEVSLPASLCGPLRSSKWPAEGGRRLTPALWSSFIIHSSIS